MSQPAFIVLLAVVLYLNDGAAVNCPAGVRFGNGPPASCSRPSDPNNLPASRIENWLTKEVFDVGFLDYYYICALNKYYNSYNEEFFWSLTIAHIVF
jgi:hypothetical protein